MKKNIALCALLLVGLISAGCASRPGEIPAAAVPPPTATPALDADTLYGLLVQAIQKSDAADDPLTRARRR
jgi:hypothetical protein